MFAQALPGGLEPGPNESRSYAEWLGLELQGGAFFAQNGLLFERLDQLEPQLSLMTQAQRLVQVLAADPSLR